MSIETSSLIVVAIIAVGLLLALYYAIKDRAGILRSIKPDSWYEFFGFRNASSATFPPLYIVLRFVFNLFTLVIWVPFWILDKLFGLKIFEENNQK
jgi:hypothetical protein